MDRRGRWHVVVTSLRIGGWTALVLYDVVTSMRWRWTKLRWRGRTTMMETMFRLTDDRRRPVRGGAPAGR